MSVNLNGFYLWSAADMRISTSKCEVMTLLEKGGFPSVWWDDVLPTPWVSLWLSFFGTVKKEHACDGQAVWCSISCDVPPDWREMSQKSKLFIDDDRNLPFCLPGYIYKAWGHYFVASVDRTWSCWSGFPSAFWTTNSNYFGAELHNAVIISCSSHTNILTIK